MIAVIPGTLVVWRRGFLLRLVWIDVGWAGGKPHASRAHVRLKSSSLFGLGEPQRTQGLFKKRATPPDGSLEARLAGEGSEAESPAPNRKDTMEPGCTFCRDDYTCGEHSLTEPTITVIPAVHPDAIRSALTLTEPVQKRTGGYASLQGRPLPTTKDALDQD